MVSSLGTDRSSAGGGCIIQWLFHKGLQLGKDLLVGIFYDVVSRRLQPHGAGGWQECLLQFETFWSETPVPHAPEKKCGQTCERGEFPLNIF